ncbi:MAG: CDP-glycerol glycerophosphotransferase family protein [Propionibacteriaceae bacterium]|jgi:CDP-glycerol glycerophosphotransferase (TagB/SpsB family)|nr:CDP-glycerol glycerophosphotransferase family protein [Propionibacteriaceae bacterium]
MPQYSRIEMWARRAHWDETGARLRLYRLGRRVVRDITGLFLKKPLGWVAQLQHFEWVDGGLLLGGWAFERGTGSNDVAAKITLEFTSGRKRLSFPAQPAYDPLANVGLALTDVDYAAFAFTATIDIAQLLRFGKRDWQVRAVVDSGGRTSSGPFTKRGAGTGARWLFARIFDGQVVVPVWADGLTLRVRAARPLAEIDAAAPDPGFVVRPAAGRLLAQHAELVEQPELGLLVTGIAAGVSESGLFLRGPRSDEPVALGVADGRFRAFIELTHSTWGRPKLPLPPGSYELLAEPGQPPVVCPPSFAAAMPRTVSHPQTKLRLGVGEQARLNLRIGRPLADDEVSDYQQTRLKFEYHAMEFQPRDAFYFESFNAKVANDSPYALDRELARAHPDIPRYWGVLDLSIPVPEGSIPVVKGTADWWRARSTCRYVVINEWIRQKFKHQPFQTVLQTWHGTMFKLIGTDRPVYNSDWMRWFNLEKAKWDVLLSQNPHSSEIFRRAYEWDGPIWEEGYPRNDVLVGGDGGPIRELLGIEPGRKVVLYAPTWRDDREGELVDFLDLGKLAADLGQEYLILLRGHSRTLREGEDVRVPGVLDVTSYPDVSELFLAADLMITDYSSVMFDYSVTGRPMVFFTPDIEQYRDVTRGVYFSLEDCAPGPVAYTQGETLAAILNAEADKGKYARRYADWRERFNPHDDGRVSQRVIARLLG